VSAVAGLSLVVFAGMRLTQEADTRACDRELGIGSICNRRVRVVNRLYRPHCKVATAALQFCISNQAQPDLPTLADLR